MALSPWPTSPAALATATATLKAAIGEDLDNARVQQLGSMASSRIEREAPRAPQAVKDEAVIRYAGYMVDGAFGAVESESIGDGSVTYQRNNAGAFRLCGASGLLAPWKIRRAGRIG